MSYASKKVGFHVFKPANEEPFAENNPRGYVPHHRGAAPSSSSSSSDASGKIVVLPPILRMPIETVLHLASSYLRPCDVRSLACTCQRMSYALLHDESASNFLWMARLVESFPDALRRRAVAVDSRRRDRALPLLLQGAPPPGIVVPTLDVDVAKNLHLLRSMLPGRYPRVIDLGGASSSSETEEADDDDGRPLSLTPFVSYEVESSSSITPEVDAIPPNATAADVAPVRPRRRHSPPPPTHRGGTAGGNASVRAYGLASSASARWPRSC